MLHVPLANLVRRQRGRLNNLAVLLVANVFTAGVGFVTTVTIANTLGAARFGELAYALAIGGILAVNVRFGMDRSLIRDLAHYPERFSETLAASLLARGLLLVFSLAGLAVLAALPIAGLELSWGMLLVIAATALSPLQIANVFDIWEVQGRHALYGCLERGVYFALVWAVLLAAPERLGLAWIGLALLAATFSFLFLQYRYAWKRLKPTLQAIPARRLARTAAGLLAGNTWLWLANLAVLGMYSLNNVVLKHVAGCADLGVYGASFQLISVGQLLLKNMARIGRPILARHTAPRAAPGSAARFLALYLAAGIVAVGLIALPAIAVPQWILRAVFTSEYAAGYWVLRLMGIYLFFRVFDIILGQYVIMVRMDKVFLATSTAAGLTALAASLILIPPFAAVGAAIALLAGEIIFAAIYVFATLCHIKHVSPVRGDGPIIIKTCTIHNNTVIKKGNPERLRLEAYRTMRAFEIGERSGLFRVPRVLDYDESKGILVLERLHDITTFRAALTASDEGRVLVHEVAVCLATIHKHLHLPADMHVPLPPGYSFPGPCVALHGDLSANNVFVATSEPRIVILDWQASPVIGGEATVGTPYFDVAWFVYNIFGAMCAWNTASRCGKYAIPTATRYVKRYLVASEREHDVEGIVSYLRQFFEHRFAPKIPMRWWLHAMSKYYVRRKIRQFLNGTKLADELVKQEFG